MKRISFQSRRYPRTSVARRLGSIGLLFAVIAAMLTACDSPESSKLRLAINPWPGYGYFAVAQEQGFLDGENAVELDIVETASLKDSLRAFERGQVDLIGGTLAELTDINAHGRRDARALLVLNRSLGGDMIVATESIESVGDLAGKRVALEAGSANMVVLAAAASVFGLDLDSVNLIALPQGEMPSALRKGKIDAAVTYPPTSQALLRIEGTHRLFDTRATPNAVVDVLIAADDVIQNHPKALARLIAGHDQALTWSRDNPKMALRLLAEHAGQPIEEATEIHDGIEMLTLQEQHDHWGPTGPLHRAMSGTADILSRLHDHESPNPERIGDMLDDRFVQKANAR
ncbi:ABC transporter substrate-binding protein [Guyparkeria sp.]|uniref:ABC transporter substrate-binding protein n=1 Tax=Guyparkeria sp. TaxID=2035736 RepID=UPI0039704BD8